MEFGLVVAAMLVAANGFFVGTEFAVARLRPTQVADFLRDRRPGAKSAKHAVEHIDAYLSACQLGITLSSLGLGAVGKPAFESLLEPVVGDSASVLGFGIAAILAFSIITVAHVVLGELAPKSAAISRTGPVALLLAPPMRAFYMATKPVVDLFNAMGNLVLKPFGVPPPSEADVVAHSEEELRELLRQSSDEGMLHGAEGEYAEQLLLFGDRRAREVMRPRPSIDYVTTADSARHVADVAMRTGRTRLPLCEPEGGLDSAIGIINVKDLLSVAFGSGDDALRTLARPLPRVAESTLVDEVLRDLRRERRHIALVVDEHGTAIGLLTLEDIIEEIVGEIEDEFDIVAADLVKRENGYLRIDGSAPARLIAQELGLALDEELHEATIGGHLLEELGRMPEPGEMVDLHGTAVEVTGIGDARITELRVAVAAEPPPAPEER
jgi:CBS domain containing-hemolysin-like protein